MINYLEGGQIILQLPPGKDGMVGPQLIAVSLMQGRELLVQGLELGIQAVQGCSGVGCGLGNHMYQEDLGRRSHWGFSLGLASPEEARLLRGPRWGRR